MINKRLINCDFLNVSGFKLELSNKAKLLYFFFLTNADDWGFVGNAKDLAETLDRCEENFENTLFTFSYLEATKELVDKRLVYEFVDKCKNRIYLIRHWFFHNKRQDFLTTNFMSLAKKVELINNEYQLKPLREEEDKDKNKIKENKENQNLKSNSLKDMMNDIDTSSITKKSNIDERWERILNDLDNEERNRKKNG